ncbi:MAG TPA: 2OG-Fe(II) oxygenase family protein [Pseudomonadales bacterium]|nr:2OG-Fe(II) oxygenase family protein [Pseudomonadales bacterium]
MSGAPLEIAADLPRAALRAAFAEHGRLHVAEVLTEASAQRIHRTLVAQNTWNLVTRQHGRHLDMDYTAVEAWSRADRDRLAETVRAGARDGFQYLYANVPIYDVWHGRLLPGHFFETLFEFLNGEPFLSLVRDITGADDIAFADGQATRYGPGHFLTRHDDDVAGKARRVAYVLNLTPEWQADWGGILQFIGADGHLDAGYVPAWNALNLFRVPQPHAVSLVAPFARGHRYAITGWLRAGVDPGPRRRA